MHEIPTIDLSDAFAGDMAARIRTADAIDEACRTSGFMVITGHGVDASLLDDLVAVSRQFFGLSAEEKSRVAPPGPYDFRGYLGIDTTALAATLGDETPPDLCESFNVSRFDDDDYRSRVCVPGAEPVFCPNQWPSRPDGFRPAFERYFGALQEVAVAMLPLFARALGLPENWFDGRFDDHTSLLLVNWYPPVSAEPRAGQLRRGAHTDYGAFTIVAVESIPGLEISIDGEWRAIPAVPGGFVVNLGDLMARWTNDRWVSTLHRVVVPAGDHRGRDRVSVPFFVQPTFTTVVETIPTTITEDRPLRYAPVVSGEWIAAKSMSMLEE